MYSREKRRLYEPKKNTAPHVGPGTYERTKAFSQTAAPEPSQLAMAPFNSFSSRETPFDETKLSTTPAPNSYVRRKTRGVFHVGPSLGMSERFHSDETLAPPPNQYNVARSLKGQEAVGPKAPINNFSTKPTIFFERKTAASSIPARMDNRGYKVAENGDLIKASPRIKAPEELGPGTYNIAKSEESATSSKYKGATWSKQRSRRALPFEADQRRALDEPSPLHYYKERTILPERGSRVNPPFQTTSVRDIAEPYSVPLQEPTPNPTSYSVPSLFNAQTSHAAKPQHFGTTSERFPAQKFQTPGPGDYDASRPAIRIKKTTTVDGLPFLQTSERFERDHAIKHTPGPQYALSSSFTTHSVGSHAHQPFGSTDRRTLPFYKKEAMDTPAPGAHQHDVDGIGAPRLSHMSTAPKGADDPIEGSDGNGHAATNAYNHLNDGPRKAGRRSSLSRAVRDHDVAHGPQQHKSGRTDDAAVAQQRGNPLRLSAASTHIPELDALVVQTARPASSPAKHTRARGRKSASRSLDAGSPSNFYGNNKGQPQQVQQARQYRSAVYTSPRLGGFGSTTSRFADTTDYDIPPPSTYMPTITSTATTSAPFRSTSKRTDLPFTPSLSTPEPGTYNVHGSPLYKGKGKLADHSRDRFRMKLTDAPPPTAYSLHPSVRDSTYKKSFNVTIDKTS